MAVNPFYAFKIFQDSKVFFFPSKMIPSWYKHHKYELTVSQRNAFHAKGFQAPSKTLIRIQAPCLLYISSFSQQIHDSGL